MIDIRKENYRISYLINLALPKIDRQVRVQKNNMAHESSHKKCPTIVSQRQHNIALEFSKK
jgi:hypothetical protein